MNNTIIKFLTKKGYNLPSNTEIYDYVGVWENWYDNNVDFHTYKDNYGTTRKMYSLGMAKRLSEDWSSIIFTEKDEITTDKKQNKKFLDKIIKKIKLRKKLPEMIETSAWSGTCGCIYRLKNIKVTNGIMEATEDTDYDLIYVSAKNIIPLRIEHGKIIDVAFVSNITKNSKKLIYIELHQLTKDGYKISNSFIEADTGEEIEDKDTIKEYYTQTNIPLFSILKPPIVNKIENNLGLGLSIYANAIDQLKATDVIYHNFIMDFVLGGKKIIYNKKLIKYKTVEYKESGERKTKEVPIYPDDISKQQFMEVGDGLSSDELVHEINPTLRVDENKEGLQLSLDILSFMANLGTKYYEFSGGSVVTATQYAGDRQDLMKNANKYRNNLDEFISDIIKGALLLGRLVFKEKVDENCIVSVTNRDGILVSDEEIKEQYRQEYNMGLMSKRTYLMKINNWTEEEALAELQKIEEENSIKEVSEE